MTGKVIRIPFRSDLSPDEEIMLEAATEWLLTEIENNPFRTDERISVGSMRSIAEKELRRPRDEIHRLWAEAFIRETDGIEFDHVRPEIRTLVRRGNVTPAEIKELRCNSWEWEALVPAMNDEAFIDRMEYALNNCFTKRERPYSTYNQAIEGLYVPELLRRFAATKLAKAIANTGGGIAEAIAHGSGPGLTEPLFPSTNLVCLKCRALEHDLEEMAKAADVQSQQRDGAVEAAKDLYAQLESEKVTSRTYAETIDNVREALGLEATHYLVIADDVKRLVEAVEGSAKDGGEEARWTLDKLREEGMYRTAVGGVHIFSGPKSFSSIPSLVDTVPDPPPRNQDGFINNCALANCDEEKNCQVCFGQCPDRERFEVP